MAEDTLKKIYAEIDLLEKTDEEKAILKTQALKRVEESENIENVSEEEEVKEEAVVDQKVAAVTATEEEAIENTDSASEDGSSELQEAKDENEAKEKEGLEYLKTLTDNPEYQTDGEFDTSKLSSKEKRKLRSFKNDQIAVIDSSDLSEGTTINYRTSKGGGSETTTSVVENIRKVDNSDYIIKGRKSSEIYNFNAEGNAESIKEGVTDEDLLKLYIKSQKKNIAYIEPGTSQQLETVDVTKRKVYDKDGNLIEADEEMMKSLYIQEDINDNDNDVTIEELIETSISNFDDALEYDTGLDIGFDEESAYEDIPENEEGKRKTINYSNAVDVRKAKSIIFHDFIKNNKVVQEIIEIGKNEINYEEKITQYKIDYSKKYPVDTAENFAKNIDKIRVNEFGELYYPGVEEYGSGLVVDFLSSDDKFINIMKGVETKIDDRFEAGYSEYVRETNTYDILRFSLGDTQTGYSMMSSLQSFDLQFKKGEKASEIVRLSNLETSLEKARNVIAKNGFATDVKGYIIPDFMFNPPNTLDGMENPYKDIIEGKQPDTFYIWNGEDLGSKTIKVQTFREFERTQTEVIKDQYKLIEKNISDIELSEEVLSKFDRFDFEAIEKGDDILGEIAKLASEQVVMMGTAIVSVGTAPAFLQALESYNAILEKAAIDANPGKYKEGEKPSVEDILAIVPTEAESASAKAIGVGIVYGGLEVFAAGKILKLLGGKQVINSLVRNFTVQNLKNVAKGFGMTAGQLASKEGMTEFLQELTVMIGEGDEIDGRQLYVAGATGVIAGLSFGMSGYVGKQGVTELKSVMRKATESLNPKGTEAFLTNMIKEHGDIDTSNMSQEEKTNHDLNYKNMVAFKDANGEIKNFTTKLEGEAKLKMVQLLVDLSAQQAKAKAAKVEDPATTQIIENLEYEIAAEMNYNKNLDLLSGTSKNLETLFNNANTDTNNSVKISKTQEENAKINKDLLADGWVLNKNTSSNTGEIYQRGNEQIVVLNINRSALTNNIADTEHEFVHALLYQTVKGSPETQKALGDSMLGYIKDLYGKKSFKNSKFSKRLAQYGKIVNGELIVNPAIKEGDYYEETMTLFAEAIVNKEIKMPKNRLLEFGKMISRVYKSALVKFGQLDPSALDDKLEFNTADDVANFIAAAVKSVETGVITKDQERALSQGGITGALIAEKLTNEQQELDKKELKGESKASKKQITDDVEKTVIIDLDLINELKQESDNNTEVNVRSSTLDTLEKSVIEAISPTVNAVAENRTKALFDNIPVDQRSGLTRQEYRQNLINDMNLMVINEYDPSKQSLEDFIVNRGFLRAYGAATKYGVKQQSDDTITNQAWVTDTDGDGINETSTGVIEKARKISPSAILGEEGQLSATQSVMTELENMNVDPNNLSYAQILKLKSLTAKEVSDFMGIKIEKILNAQDNLTKPESAEARRKINKHAQDFMALLPEGYITTKGVSEGLVGTSTGVPLTLLKLFYTKSEKRGKNLTPWVLRKDITRREFLAAFGINTDGTFNAKSDGQKIKALAVLMQANVANEIVRGIPGLSPEAIANIKKGTSRSMASLKSPVFQRDEMKNSQFVLDVVNGFEAFKDGKGEAVFAGLNGDQILDQIEAFDLNEESYRKINPEGYSIIRQEIEKKSLELANEGDQKGYTTRLKNEIKSPEFKEKFPGLTAPMTTMSSTDFLANKDGALDEFLLQSYDVAREFGGIFNLFNSGNVNQVTKEDGSFKGGNDPSTFMMALFGTHRGIIGPENSLVESDHMLQLKTQLQDGSGSLSIFSPELQERIKNFKFGDLVSTYNTTYATNYEKVLAIKDPKERRKLAAKLFGNEGAKATAELYDIWNTGLNEWLYASEVNSKEFNAKADYIMKLKKSNSAAGTTGERNLAAISMLYLGDDADFESRLYVEHLGPSSNQSFDSMNLILNNSYASDGSALYSSSYQAIYGSSNIFKIIDDSTGKTNASQFFRFAETIHLAKDTYTIEDGFSTSVYDLMKKQIYDVPGRGKVSGAVLIQEIETQAEGVYNINSSIIDAILGPDGIDPTDINNPKYANNQTALDIINDLKENEEAQSLIDLTGEEDIQSAKASLAQTSTDFINEAIELNTGIKQEYTYSDAKGRMAGDNVTRSFLNTVIPYSAEDFRGLLYVTLANGKKGEQQMDYYKKHILNPFNEAEGAVTKRQVSLANDFQELKRQFPSMPTTLKEKVGIDEYTHSDALRTYIWTQQGDEIPGLSKTDKRKLIGFVNANPELLGFAQGIQGIQQGDNLQGPDKNWLVGNLASDLLQGVSKGKRKDYLDNSGWSANIDAMFSPANINKLRAAYGNSYVEALQDNLRRMKSGSNRPVGGNKITDNLMDWMNNSVGTVMFLNTRSAVLQTLSSVNFVNWTDNNPLAAGKAITNVKQYSSDFMRLMNSEYLVNRRSGLKINVSESEIADAMKEGGQGPKAMINLLLNKGFVFTQYADSFAIASGGATFFRNRTNTYLKTKNPETGELYSAEEAEAQAFVDFEAISEESQQSARTDRISMQQASGAGRIVLAFANTPMQYMRIQKKAMQDILAGRGDTKSNISKLAYYGVIQNVAFNAIQNALYTEMFENDEEDGEVGKDTKAKSWDIINGMLDSNLRGMGIGGAAVSAMKNSILTIADEATKKNPRFVKAIDDLFDFSPPLDSKVRKLKSAANTISWERDQIERQGFDIDNPANLAGAQVLSAFTNIPADRALMKLNNLRNAASKRAEAWQTIALLLGVSAWEVGMPYYGVESMQEESDRIKEDDEKELLRLAKLEKARLAKLAKKREARRKLEERIRADERKRIEKENKAKENKK